MSKAKARTRKTNVSTTARPRLVKTQSSSLNLTKKTMILIAVLLVIAGYTAYKSSKYETVPLDVMVVEQPTSFSIADRFGNGALNREYWRVTKTEQVSVNETATDNLRMIIPAGQYQSRARAGNLIYKENVSASTDFTASTRLYKPVVNGEGVGRSGIKFTGGEGDDEEGVAVFWEVGQNTSELVFKVTAAGAEVRTQRVTVTGNQAQLVLKRIGTEYLAAYRVDNFDDDNPIENLGESVVSVSVTGGKLRLFANNGGLNAKYPRTVAKFDSVSLRSNPKNAILSDNFAGTGSLDSNLWRTSTKGAGGSSVKSEGNLVMSVPSATKPAGSEFVPNVYRATSVAEISRDKRGVAVVELFKPTTVGNGSAVVGLSFNSESDTNDESSSIRWVVSGNTSRLVFAVRNANGNVVERESVSIPRERNRLSIKLMHGDGMYRASYRLGAGLDDDTGFRVLGSQANQRLGAKGNFSIFATHTPVNGVAPEVTAKLDSFRVSYY